MQYRRGQLDFGEFDELLQRAHVIHGDAQLLKREQLVTQKRCGCCCVCGCIFARWLATRSAGQFYLVCRYDTRNLDHRSR